MTTIDVDVLLRPLSEADPCGSDLSEDPGFQELERIAEGKPERQRGKDILPAEDPNWKAVQSAASDVLGRSKDLRAAVLLTRAALHTEGLAGFAAGLRLVRRILEGYWDGFHPRLEDGNDPTMRMNALRALANPEATLRALRNTPLVASRAVGRFSLRDVDVAAGEGPVPTGSEGERPTLERIGAAFMDVDLADLTATAEAGARGVAEVEAIEAYLAQKVPAGLQVDLEPLRACLRAISRVLTDALARRGVGEAKAGGAGLGEGGTARATPPASSGINSWDDVERALDRICDFYRTAHPASPVPMLLQRAKSMVRMDFMQILRELAPDAVPEAEKVLKRREK